MSTRIRSVRRLDHVRRDREADLPVEVVVAAPDAGGRREPSDVEHLDLHGATRVCRAGGTDATHPIRFATCASGSIAVPGCFDSGLTALLDVFRTAERVRTTVDRSIDPIEVRTVGSAAKVTTAARPDAGDGSRRRRRRRARGARRADRARARRGDAGVAGAGARLDATSAACAAGWRRPASDARARGGLHRHVRARRRRACSTTAPRRRPGGSPGSSGGATRRSQLDMSRMVIHSGPVTTAGAAFAHIDLGDEPRLARQPAAGRRGRALPARRRAPGDERRGRGRPPRRPPTRW